MKFQTKLRTTQDIFVCLFLRLRWRIYKEETRLQKTIHWIFWGHSPMFCDIPWNVWGHSPECLARFPRRFEDTAPNVWRQFLKCLATFPDMFSDVPWNVCGHSLEYNIPLILCIPCIPFPVPPLSTLCRCQLNRVLMKIVCIVVLIRKLSNISIYRKQQAWCY